MAIKIKEGKSAETIVSELEHEGTVLTKDMVENVFVRRRNWGDNMFRTLKDIEKEAETRKRKRQTETAGSCSEGKKAQRSIIHRHAAASVTPQSDTVDDIKAPDGAYVYRMMEKQRFLVSEIFFFWDIAGKNERCICRDLDSATRSVIRTHEHAPLKLRKTVLVLAITAAPGEICWPVRCSFFGCCQHQNKGRGYEHKIEQMDRSHR